MDLTYDAEADAAYMTLGGPIAPGQAAQQIHSLATPGNRGEVTLDFDAEGRLLGVEVLNASAVLAPDLLDGAGPPGPG
ncbi:DUF2283 domain-containing protein [Nocardiopsis sp. HNM0947]|uniref:DUF2283 domain-containing protein n=1 Tax=Nocardiopsis coralli TaxID=2772213 RepID=A0ABR9P2J0_9ACTN|nr:DUF2283 domain-containing protein [Nocardiopsis coralli]MBE2998060.1 DUF2283 domain-containing protein [Nocardiopsis coralli]